MPKPKQAYAGKFIVARNDWSADFVLRRIKQGRINPEQVLFNSQAAAAKRIRNMRGGKQEEFSIFQIKG